MTIKTWPVYVLGVEQWVAVVTDSDGTLLKSVTRWSEAYARRDAYTWVMNLGRMNGVMT